MLTVTEVCQLKRDGFVAVVGAVPDTFCLPALAALTAWHARLDSDDERLWFRDQAPDSYGAPFWSELTRVTDSVAAALAESGRSWLLAPQLIGSPGGQATDPRARGWHIDTVEVARRDGFPTDPPEFPQFDLIVGVYLTDMTEPGSGYLNVWPGSHRVIAERCAAEPDVRSFVPRLYAELASEVRDPIPVLGPRGTLIVMNSFVAHDTTVNRSAQFSGRAYLRYAHEGIDRATAWRSGNPWFGWKLAEE